MKRKPKQKCIPGLSASASSRLRKRARDERFEAACDFVWIYQFDKFSTTHWWLSPRIQHARAGYNRARALAAECGV